MWSRRLSGVTKLKMASTLKERLTTLLVQRNLLTPDKLEKALKIQKEKKERIGDILVELGYISRDNLLEVLSTELNIPAIHLSKYKITPETLALVPKKVAEHYCLIPVSSFESTITLAMSDPMNVNALDDIRRPTGLEVRPVLASDKDIKGVSMELDNSSDVIILTRAENPRAENPLRLKENFCKGCIYLTNNGQEALDMALRIADEEDLLLVTGSLYIVGEAIKLMKQGKAV